MGKDFDKDIQIMNAIFENQFNTSILKILRQPFEFIEKIIRNKLLDSFNNQNSYPKVQEEFLQKIEFKQNNLFLKNSHTIKKNKISMEQLNEIILSLEKRIQELQEQNNKLEQENQLLISQNGELQQKNLNMTNYYTGFSDKQKNDQSQIQQQQKEMKKKEELISNQKSYINHMQDEKVQYTTDIESLEAQVNDLEGQLQKLSEMNSQLLKENATLKAQIEIYQYDDEKTSKKQKQMVSNDSKKNVKVEENQTNYQELKTMIESIKDELNQQKKEHKIKDKQIINLQKNISDQTQTNSYLTQTISDLTLENTNTKKRVSYLEMLILNEKKLTFCSELYSKVHTIIGKIFNDEKIHEIWNSTDEKNKEKREQIKDFLKDNYQLKIFDLNWMYKKKKERNQNQHPSIDVLLDSEEQLFKKQLIGGNDNERDFEIYPTFFNLLKDHIGVLDDLKEM